MTSCKLFIIIVSLIFFNRAWGYYYLQEDYQLNGYWDTVNSSTQITPGLSQAKSSAGVLKVRFRPTADFVAYRTNSGEQTRCLSGCNDGSLYFHPFIHLDRWQKGAALGISPSFSLTNENGVTRTFYAVGILNNRSGLIMTDSSVSSVSDFGDGIATHYSPWIGSFQLPYDVPYLFHGRNGESYTFSIPLRVPDGTEAGTYTNKGGMVVKVNYQYCGTGCSPQFGVGRAWINDYRPPIRVIVPNVCSFSDSRLTINYGSFSISDIQGKIAPSVWTTLKCNSSVTSGSLKLISASGRNWSSDIGTSVKVKDKLDAILRINGRNASNGITIPVNSQMRLEITAMLNTNGYHPEPGPFSGNAILSFSPN